MIEPSDLDLRPVRPADRGAVAGLAGDSEPVPFDDWVETPAGLFWAAEVLGQMVAVVRVRSVARGVFHVDGLLVGGERRRQGIGTALLDRMVAIVRGQGGLQVRGEAMREGSRRLGARAAFRSVASAHAWRATRLEGGEPARLALERDLPHLAELARAAPELELGGGRLLAPGEARDVGGETLAERVGAGAVRLAGGGRAVAVVAMEEPRLVVAALFGRPALWPELLEQLRFEADQHDVGGVDVWLPADHPATTALESVGYHRDDAARLDSLQRELDA